MLQPTVRRTWSPEGQTPIHYSWDRRDRLSALSAITVSPRRRRLGLYFPLRARNIVTKDVERLVGALLRRLQRPVTLVLDRWSVHRSATRHLLERFGRRVHREWLPAYAPELNPVEGVWGRAKYTDLANFIPDDLPQLRQAVRQSLRHTRTQHQLLRSFFQHAKLNL